VKRSSCEFFHFPLSHTLSPAGRAGISIYNLQSLSYLNLPGIVNVTNSIYISLNPLLENLNGLSTIQLVAASTVEISFLDTITNIDGLSPLAVDGASTVDIHDNAILQYLGFW